MAGIATRHRGQAETPHDWSLWRRWVLANTAGEVVGLGGTAALGAALILGLGMTAGVVAALAAAGVMIFAGTLLEGVVVGTAQWLALRGTLPALPRRSWVGATALGAGVAWTLGMVPSTALSLGAEERADDVAEPRALVVYGLAVLMGLVLGPILGLPQWRILRRHLPRAGWWIAANAVAWAAGMPVIFAGMDVVAASGGPERFVAAVITLAIAGAIVGAIHGLALVRLLRMRRLATEAAPPRQLTRDLPRSTRDLTS